MFPEYTLIIGGYQSGNYLDTVEVVSADPISNPVPECMKNISSFPVRIRWAVGTTFGALEDKNIMLRLEDCFLYIFVTILLFQVESPMFAEAMKTAII